MQAAQPIAQVVVDPYLAAQALQQLRATLLPPAAESLDKSTECPVCLESTPCQKCVLCIRFKLHHGMVRPPASSLQSPSRCTSMMA